VGETGRSYDWLRQSNEYQDWKKLLHDFYDPYPVVEYFESV
jgi:hypothetical protein